MNPPVPSYSSLVFVVVDQTHLHHRRRCHHNCRTNSSSYSDGPHRYAYRRIILSLDITILYHHISWYHHIVSYGTSWNHHPIIPTSHNKHETLGIHASTGSFRIAIKGVDDHAETYLVEFHKGTIQCPSLWPSGFGSRLGQNRLWVRFLAVSDIYPMFIEPTITWVPSVFSGYIWLDPRIVLKKKYLVSKDFTKRPCHVSPTLFHGWFGLAKVWPWPNVPPKCTTVDNAVTYYSAIQT